MLYSERHSAERQAEDECCRSVLLAMHTARQADQQAGDSDSSPAVADSAGRTEGSVIAGAGITIGQYAGCAADVWDNEGKHYDLLSASGRLAALRCSDSFVRNMALAYEPDTCCCWPCVILNREFHKTWFVIRWWRKLCKRSRQ